MEDYDDDPFDDDDDWEREGKLKDDVYIVINNYNKKFKSEAISLSLDTLPSCCSALVLSGVWVGGKSKKEVSDESLVQLVRDIIKAATPNYAFLISTLLMPRQEKWAEVLKKAGFEESAQIAASNSYNGAIPLRVYIKSLRPMTEDEIKTKTAEYKKHQENYAKGGYEW